MGVGNTRSSIFIIISGHKFFFCIYNPSQILESVRNNLFNHVVETEGKQIKWEYIKSNYNMEKARGNTHLRANHKMTDKHIELPAFSKMSVPLAAQTPSHSVTAGINMAVPTNALPPEAAYTTDICEKME